MSWELPQQVEALFPVDREEEAYVVVKIEVDPQCSRDQPCKHKFQVTFRNGETQEDDLTVDEIRKLYRNYDIPFQEVHRSEK